MKAYNFQRVEVTKKGEAALRGGHPWVYGEEITSLPEGGAENGALTDVYSQKGAYLGTGFFSESSKIKVRILSADANESFGRAFFERRLRYALDYRRAVMGGDFECCRLVFGEADGLPGLTVDRFGQVLAAQVLSYGMDKIKAEVFGLLLGLLRGSGEKIAGIYERSDAAIRTLEGLGQYKGWFVEEGAAPPEISETEITENGIKYRVDFICGQKTGFFLDQKYNRAAAAKIARGRKVLDCFTHTGSFALNAAAGGAEAVTAVDISRAALDEAKNNAALNSFESKVEFICADVFDLLSSLEREGRRPYDFIILDPPAFAKSRKALDGAERGYKEINYRAMKLLPRGGFLATCSCSHFMTEDLFSRMLRSAAADAGVQLKMVEARRQSPDHPILWNVPETDYLKFYIFQII